MKNSRSLHTWCARFAVTTVVGLSLLLSRDVQIKVMAQGENGQGDEHSDERCDHLPNPPGNAYGILKHCPVAGNSSGISRGDFNGDNVADLAIGAPGEDVSFAGIKGSVTDAGAVHIIYGTAANGLVTSGSNLPSTQLITGANPSSIVFPTNKKAETSDSFGTALAAGDFNGDNISDLAVGVTGERVSGTTSIGAVEVFLGTAGGLSTTSASFFGPSTFVQSPDPGGALAARSLTWGDFDNDDVGDLAVASEFQEGVGRVGMITVLFGVEGVGLTTDRKVQFRTATAPVETHPSLPLILSAGDFDGDGFSDLVAGSPFVDIGNSLLAGSVFVLYGGDEGPRLDRQQIWAENSPNIPSDVAQFENFGAAVAVGDFNGDTFDDLAIGAPNEVVSSIFAGAVFVIHGAPGIGLTNPASGTLASLMFTQSSMSPDPSESGDQFGAALAAGFFNGDLFKDLAIGVPREDIGANADAGVVHVIYGSSASLSTNLVRSVQNITQGGGVGDAIEANDRFGSSLTAWNFGRTTQADLAIGVPLEDVGSVVDAGLVHVIYGTSTGLSNTGAQTWTQDTTGVPETSDANDRFGQALY